MLRQWKVGGGTLIRRPRVVRGVSTGRVGMVRTRKMLTRGSGRSLAVLCWIPSLILSQDLEWPDEVQVSEEVIEILHVVLAYLAIVLQITEQLEAHVSLVFAALRNGTEGLHDLEIPATEAAAYLHQFISEILLLVLLGSEQKGAIGKLLRGTLALVARISLVFTNSVHESLTVFYAFQ